MTEQQTAFVIMHSHHDPDTDEPLFWSNADGWVSLCTATTFRSKETTTTHLPDGAWGWLELPKSELVISFEELPLTNFDTRESLAVVWQWLHAVREEFLPEGDESHDEQWDEICTAMAWISEALHPPVFTPDEWSADNLDGNIFRLKRLTQEAPHRFTLESTADYFGTSRDNYAVENVVDVEASAFNDFDELCTFAKEVGLLLHCDPALIVRSIRG